MPLGMKRLIFLTVAGLAAAYTGSASADGFTAEQAEAGKSAYNSNCARCHGYQLEGPDAPGLAGRDVMMNWDTAGGLYDFISVAMPPEAPGELGEETYVNIIAYIMSFNGAQPGEKPLAVGDEMYEVSLAAETAAGASAASAAAPAEESSPATAVPQAFTWGKQLPGGPAPAAPAEAAKPSVPQAFTWGKKLPSANGQ